MTKRAKALLLCLAALGTLLAVGSMERQATAQAACYPEPLPGQTCPPTSSPSTSPVASPTSSPTSTTPAGGPLCNLETCLHMTGEINGEFVENQAVPGGRIRVRSFENCCESNARIDVYVESERQYLGTVFATEDGSYFGEFTVPANLSPGDHDVVVDIEGCGLFRRPISVLSSDVLGEDDDNDDDGDGGGSGTGAGGTGNRGNVGSSGGGTLPRTGAGILLLLLWAIVLIAGGTTLARKAWKYRQRFAPAFVSKAGRRSGETLMLPAPEIPLIDTSRFVPSSARTRRPEDVDEPRQARFAEMGRFGADTEADRPENLSEWDDEPEHPAGPEHPLS